MTTYIRRGGQFCCKFPSVSVRQKLSKYNVVSKSYCKNKKGAFFAPQCTIMLVIMFLIINDDDDETEKTCRNQWQWWWVARWRRQIQLVGHDAVRDAYVACHRAQFVNSVSQKHLSPEENLCFLKLFSQRLRNLSKILHSYCMFISAPSYKILFNYR